jgi:hypothetical protein
MSKAWDKIFLVTAFVILAGVAGYLGWSATGDKAALVNLTETKSKAGKPPEPIDPDVLKTQRESWLQPHLWDFGDKDHQFFVGRRYLYFPDENVIKPYDDNLLIDGLPLAWIAKYNLQISDRLVAQRDSDGDGFTNLAEFKAQTNPLDPNSHPPYSSILRIKNISAKSYRIRFSTKFDNDGQSEFQLNTPDSTKSSHSVKQGESFDGFKVVGYTAKSKNPEPPDYVSDISELQLLNEKTGDTVTLVINKEQDVPEITVSFVLLIPTLVDQPVSVKVGEEFTIPLTIPNNPTPLAIKFKLTKGTKDSAAVVDEAIDKEVPIPLFDDKNDPLLIPQVP